VEDTLFVGRALNELCCAVTQVARRLCSTYVDPKGLTGFVACGLMALDISIRVKPIGVGKVLQRVIRKAVQEIATDDIRVVVGYLKLCMDKSVDVTRVYML